MNWIVSVFFPVMIHLVISEGAAVLAGNVLDSAACTALSAVLTLPFGIWMYRQDEATRALHGASCCRSTAGGHYRCVFLYVLCAFLCLAGGCALNICWSGILNFLRIGTYFSNETQETLFSSNIFMQLLGPGLFVPIAEELIFRGLVYARMRIRLQVGSAAFFSALLFALYHGNPIQVIYVFPMAIVLALLYEYGGKLIYPILFHMGANLAAILMV